MIELLSPKAAAAQPVDDAPDQVAVLAGQVDEAAAAPALWANTDEARAIEDSL